MTLQLLTPLLPSPPRATPSRPPVRQQPFLPALPVRDALPDRPDVAFLVFDLRGSGVVRNLCHLVNATVEAGWRVCLVMVRDGGELAGQPLDPQVERHILLPGHALPQRALAIAQAVPAMRRWLANHHPRVLFSAGSHIHPLAAAAVVGQAARPRVIMRLSNDFRHERPRGVGRMLSRLRAPLMRGLMRRVASQADDLVCVARELADRASRELAPVNARLHAIPNGVDIAGVSAAGRAAVSDPWFSEGTTPVVLGIGRLVAQKNFAMLLRAFALARARRPLRLAILGTGGQQATLQRLAIQLGIADDVRLMGFDANPYRYLARASLLVQTSLWEGMPNVLLEAFAAGCPVVATRCPTGVVELVETPDGPLAPLVALDDVPGLAQAMLDRLDASRDSDRLIARARQFERSHMLHRYVDLIEASLATAP
ncbi:glycosyltransferase [Parapedomonas caeni]